MPVYEYRCGGCEKVFQAMRKVGSGADGLSCPSCGGDKLTKILSATFTPDSSKAMPSSMESCAPKMPGMGGGCPSGMCGSGMCGM